VDGEIDVSNTNDSVTLTNVAGSVVASAHNGAPEGGDDATRRRLSDGVHVVTAAST
jgi:hypothetical protein